MEITTVVSLVKDRLGIRSNVRDTYLTAIVEGVIKELQDEKGLVLDGTNSYHLMFVVDYATWRYQSVTVNDSTSNSKLIALPRYLQYRLHNLIIHTGSGKA